MPLLLASLGSAISIVLAMAGGLWWCLGFGPDVLVLGLNMTIVFLIGVLVTWPITSRKR